jgi:carbonic anhydrase
MRKLLQGIRTFQDSVFPTVRARFEELAKGQSPPTLLITCSDSRVMPELFTHTGPGEVFVLRNAGNFVPPYTAEHTGEAATVEYAVKALGVEDIVVCGHSHCGAVKGVLDPKLVEEMPAVAKWLSHAEGVREAIVESRVPIDLGDDALTAAVKLNVLVQLEHLRTYPAIVEAEARGAIMLHGCFHRFETGEVTVFDASAGLFVAIDHHSVFMHQAIA